MTPYLKNETYPLEKINVRLFNNKNNNSNNNNNNNNKNNNNNTNNNNNNNSNNNNNNNSCVYSSQPEHKLQVAPLKYCVYKILKSETNIAETATQFTTP